MPKKGLLGGLMVPVLAACGLSAMPLDPEWLDALRKDDIAALRALVQQHHDLNAPTADGSTALHWAAYLDNLAAVDLFIRSGARVETKTRYGVSPLYLASVNGNARMIEALLKAGADPNTAMPEGDTVLMTAARSGNVAAVRELIVHGANVHARESVKGQTALMWAAAEGYADVVKTLVDASADVRARSTGEGRFGALHFAVRANRGAAVRTLLDLGADVNETAANGASPLQLAVGGGHFELAADLLKRGADPSVGGMGWTVLHDIAFVRRPNVSYNNPGPLPTGHMDSLVLLKELVEHGADPNARATVDAMPLMFVGRSVANYKGATAFWAASLRGDVALMKALVELGADPLLPNEDGTTPLMAAAGVGLWGVLETPGTAEESLEAVKFCLAHGGSATTVDANGDTAVHGAVLRRAMGTLEVLVGAGAPLNVRNKENVPCAGCNAGVKGTGGWTPWRMAAGVYYAGAIRVDPDIAAYLERLLKERGLPVE